MTVERAWGKDRRPFRLVVRLTERHELLSKSQWHPLESLPQEQRVIDIYQSRSAPDESHLAHDWDIYLMPEDLPEAFFDCALLGLFVTVPAFLLFRLLQSQQRFQRPA